MESPYYNIISIDPGTNMGVAIYTLDSDSGLVVGISTHVYSLNNHICTTHKLNNLLLKTQAIERACTSLYNLYKPVAMVVEAAFLNSKFPKAVMQLSHFIATIDNTMFRLNPLIKFFRYPPTYVKMGIGAGGNADKVAMRKQVSSIPEITNFLDVSKVSEHEVDALAIGYVGIMNIRDRPHVLYTY